LVEPFKRFNGSAGSPRAAQSFGGRKGDISFRVAITSRWPWQRLLMPRILRGQRAGFVYHPINRGNGRATI
jgi:hypothetical protein